MFQIKSITTVARRLSLAFMFALLVGGVIMTAGEPLQAEGTTKDASPKADSAKTYGSPEKAVAALIQAATAKDRAALIAILGTQGKEVLGLQADESASDEDLQTFVQAYQAHHELININDYRILLIGAEKWPFPIPLARTAKKQWFFDTPTGLDELALRRIGRNELDVLEVCRAYFDAQMDYYRLNPEGSAQPHFAARLISTPGRKDGLYWPSQGEETVSPLGEMMAQADRTEANPADRRAYYGYYYKTLTGQGPQAPGGAWEYQENGQQTGGFALLAYPAEYGQSGVMTFMISQAGIIYEKDLGPETAREVAEMTLFNPDSSWSKVSDEPIESTSSAPTKAQSATKTKAKKAKAKDKAE